MLTRMIKRFSGKQEEGMALLLAVVATTVMGFIGASFAIMLVNETKSAGSTILAQRALYVAESGIQDVMYQRSKMPDQMCFPYFYNSTQTVTLRLDNIESLTGARSGGVDLDSGAFSTDVCNPDADNIPPETTTEELPCWPYNEKLYANYIHWGPDYKCHDGSDSSIDGCSSYQPYLWWPAESDGTIGWKDWDENNSNIPLTNANQSSGARYTTGFFTLCNDDFEGVSAGDPGYDQACNAAKTGGTCNQYVIRLSVVSVGEVQLGDKVVRRAVKADLMPPALFSGVIDKYIDLSGTYRTTIHGPIHINGWKSEGKWYAFLLSLSLYPGALTDFLDPPDLVSVSFPEDPANPDWQPAISGITLAHQITYVHLPVRIDIPSVNWEQWENRIDELFSRAGSEYSDSTVYALKRCHYDTSNVLYTTGDCGDSGQQYAPITGQPDDAGDNSFPRFDCPPNSGDGRIHNCNRNSHALWNSSTKHIFDLFDQWDDSPNTYVEGTEPTMIGGGTGPRDKSLMPKVKFIFSPSFDFSGLIGIVTCLIGGTPMQDCLLGALGYYENREEFQFMGRHEFRDFVFIDGFIGMGLRTPYHSCGEGDGGFSIYCIVIPSIDVLGLFTIPSFSFGLPHWHLGNALITGEVLVNGRLYLADYIHIDGGTIYSTEHVIKDESSGYDITVDLSSLFCTIMSWGVGSISIPLLGDLCGLLMSVLNPFVQMFVPWWPILDLTNNDLIDFETYLDIDGAGPYMDTVVAPGTLYAMGDFRLKQPGWDATSFLANWLIGQFAGFLTVTSAIDPIRLYNGGAIVAGGTPTGGAGPLGMYQYGNIYLDKHRRADIMTKNPDTGDPSNGYLFARGAVRLYGDLINDYSWGGLIDQCSASTLLALDEDCAAQGIFYSGGVAAGTRENDAFGKYTLKLSKSGYDYYTEDTCMNEKETEFWTNISDSISCITSQLGDMFGTAPVSEYNIRGHIFAGQIGAISNTNIRLEQDGTVRSDAVTRQYFKNLGGVPIDWMEISPPGNLPSLELN